MTKTVASRRAAVPHHRGHALRLRPPNGTPNPADLQAVKRWVRSAARPTAIDLFCGAGGFSLGLRDAGFDVLAGADSDPVAMETHHGNLGSLGWTGDLSDPSEFLEHLEQWGIETVDLVAGGPPCQPFSRAGSSKIRDLVRSGDRAAADPRASLWNSFMAVVAKLKPRAVLIENVPDLPSWDNGAVLIGFFEALLGLGYHVDARVLDAYRHGVPQHRARLFIIGMQGEAEVNWPREIEPAPTLRDAIWDLPPAPPAQRNEELLYFSAPHSDLAKRMRREMNIDERHRVVWDHITRDVRADDLRAFRAMPEGGTYEDLPEELRRYRSDIFTDKYKRLTWDEVSRSITAHIAKDGYWYIHPEQPRTLSVREAARVQTFPDHFRFAGEPTHRFRQIGNAVPPLLAEALGKTVKAALESSSSNGHRLSTTSFYDDLLNWHRENRRDFPWRRLKSNPWLVLMAEMCLRRTRVDQVAPTFDELRRIAPTPKALVRESHEAIEAMSRLGLDSRALSILAVARDLVERFDGCVPDTEIELRSLPGVGDYLAQAVICFGFGRRAVLVDTSTVRITGRVFGRERARRWQLRLDLYRLSGAQGPDPAFNHALLDLGSSVCKPQVPECQICPVPTHCTMAEAAEPARELAMEET
jgi:DNA (cytosine-5)-methyltransferase 1